MDAHNFIPPSLWWMFSSFHYLMSQDEVVPASNRKIEKVYFSLSSSHWWIVSRTLEHLSLQDIFSLKIHTCFLSKNCCYLQQKTRSKKLLPFKSTSDSSKLCLLSWWIQKNLTVTNLEYAYLSIFWGTEWYGNPWFEV